MTAEDLAAAVARAVLACPHVAALAGPAATHLPGQVVRGVSVRGDLGADPDRGRRQPELEVHVVARWGPTIAEVSEQVREAVRRVAPAVPLTVAIDDLDLPGPGGEGSDRTASGGSPARPEPSQPGGSPERPEPSQSSAW